MKTIVEKLPEYRKGLIAVAAAVVTVASLVGVPLAEDLPDQVIAIFDAIAAALVVIVPNEPSL